MNDEKSKVERMTSRERALAYGRYKTANRFDRLKPCEHGHLECSDANNGPCSNELASMISNASAGND